VKVSVQIAALALMAGVCFLPAAELPCASAESMGGLMKAWTAGFTARHPATPAQVVLRAKFSADFVDPLARGEVQVAPFARELFPAEQARFAGLAGGSARLVPVATGSRATKGGTHAIVIYVNEKNPLTRVSLARLRELFARDGRITTWGELGVGGEWAGRKINLHGMRVRRETGNPPGIVNFLESRLLAGRAWRDDVHEYTDTPGGPQALEQITRAVAADEAALGYSGFAYAVPGVKALALGETDAGPFYAGTEQQIAQRLYPLARTIYLGLGPAPSVVAREFAQYVLGPEGQAAVAADAEGFFPLLEPAGAAAHAVLAATVDPALPAYEPRPVNVPRGSGYFTPDGAVAVVGYNDMEQMLDTLGTRFAALHPGIRFALTLKGTKTAPPALARGESAFAPMGAEFSPQQLADYRTVTGGDPMMFRVAHCSLDPVALSGPLAVIVHRDSPLASLTLAEVADIFSGRAPRGLHLYGLNPETALGLFMRGRTLEGGGFGAGFKGFPQSRDVVQAVAADPLAIGFTAAMRAMPGVKILGLAPTAGAPPVPLTDETIQTGHYPLDRFLLIYARQPLEPVAREYLRFVLSREGQEVIARGTLGYLPLNAAEIAAERAKLE
jgi:phosphate transport system substrate-binding protein